MAQFPTFGGERFTLGADIGALLSWIAARWDKGIVVLASGDPLFYGIGTRLVAHFGIEQVRIILASAPYSICAHRLELI